MELGEPLSEYEDHRLLTISIKPSSSSNVFFKFEITFTSLNGPIIKQNGDKSEHTLYNLFWHKVGYWDSQEEETKNLSNLDPPLLLDHVYVLLLKEDPRDLNRRSIPKKWITLDGWSNT